MTAPPLDVIGGVDTHADVHVAAALDSATGRLLGTESFPTTMAGYAALAAWMRAFGTLERVGVESTGSWGAGLARHMRGVGVEVVEVDRPDRKARRLDGKSDPTDAIAAARAVLSGRANGAPKTKDGVVEAVRAVEVVYHSAVKDRTRAINQFKSLLVSAPEPLRAHLRSLTFRVQLERVRRFGPVDDMVQTQTRLALRELAGRIRFLEAQCRRLEARIVELTAQASPALVGLSGVGPHVAAQLLAAAGDNPHRMSSEAAFAKLCGACPLPASSGKTVRHRLNRGGDRRANNALFTIVLVRMRHDPVTRAYIARRRSEGKTTKETIRCLKRFVAREVYQALTHPPDDLPAGAELRALRHHHGLPLDVVAHAVATTPTRLSNLERGLAHDTTLARRCRTWLTERSG